MKFKEHFFYLTTEELKSILLKLELIFNLAFNKAGLLDERELKKYFLQDDTAFLEEVPSPDWNTNNKYLVNKKEVSVSLREVPQRSGGVKFAVDMMQNTDSLLLVVGGEYEDGIIVAGKISFPKDSDFGKEFAKEFQKLMKQIAKKEKGWFVSNNLRNGYRLTTDARMSNEYDFVF